MLVARIIYGRTIAQSIETTVFSMHDTKRYDNLLIDSFDHCYSNT